MRIPMTVFIAQWVLTSVFGIFLVVLFRQVAHLLRLAKVESGRARIGLGERVPAFVYRAYDSGESLSFDGIAPGLLLFVEPNCSSCIAAAHWLWDALRRDGDTGTLEALVVTSATRETVTRVPGLVETNLRIGLVDYGIAGEAFGVDVTPFVVANDDKGTVVFRSPVSTIGDIDSAIAILLEQSAAGTGSDRFANAAPALSS